MTKPFRAPGRRAYKIRVRHPDGRARVRGCDTENGATAKAMARWVDALYQDRTPIALAALDAIVAKRVTLGHAYDHRHDLAAFVATVDDLDLEPEVAKWHAAKSKSRKGAASADKYLTQVRELIPAKKRFVRSKFTAQTIRAHLRGLDVEDPTRNRHKAAFSSFADYLVEEGVLERNPVRDVRGWSEGQGRVTYYEREQARALIETLPYPYRAIEALMVGAGLEWQAIERLRVRDVNLAEATVQAHGGKTQWRNRLCRIVEDWTIPIIREWLRDRLPDALLFEGVREWWALKEHKEAAKRKGLPLSTLHDWRHTHAVLMLRAGYKPTVVAHQLGHRDTSLVWQRYGRFTVDSRDYVLPNTGETKEPKREAK